MNKTQADDLADAEKRLGNLREHLQKTHSVLWDEIKYADAKATAIFALSGALAAGSIQITKDPHVQGPWLFILIAFAACGLVAFCGSAFFALTTIVPRIGMKADADKKESFAEKFRLFLRFPNEHHEGRVEAPLHTPPTMSENPSEHAGHGLTESRTADSPWFHWVANYPDPQSYKQALLTNFGLPECWLYSSDKVLILELRRIGVIAHRKYDSVTQSYKWVLCQTISLVVVVTISFLMRDNWVDFQAIFLTLVLLLLLFVVWRFAGILITIPAQLGSFCGEALNEANQSCPWIQISL